MSIWFAQKDDVVCIAEPSTVHKKDLRRVGIVDSVNPHNYCVLRFGSDGPFLKNVSIFELIKIPVSLRTGIGMSGEFYQQGELGV